MTDSYNKLVRLLGGSTTLDAGRPEAESWTPRLIEDDFHRRMFPGAS